VAVHKEPGGHDVELLADVLAHAHHRLTTAAGGAFGLVTVFDARQVLRQGLAFGLTPGFSGGGLAGRAALPLQGFELGLQAGLVGGQRFLEQLALLGAHALGPGTKAPGLQAREFVRDALDFDVAPLDGLCLGLDVLALLADMPALLGNVRKHLPSHFGQCTEAQTVQVLGFEFVHVKHPPIVQRRRSNRHWGMC
jgi:hypothetical protein